jgi:hypothetical protein
MRISNETGILRIAGSSYLQPGVKWGEAAESADLIVLEMDQAALESGGVRLVIERNKDKTVLLIPSEDVWSNFKEDLGGFCVVHSDVELVREIRKRFQIR